MSDAKILGDLIAEHGLELEEASPIDSRKFVNVPGIVFTELHRYNWPKAANRSSYDVPVYIGLYPDGSYKILVPVATLD